VAGDLYLYVEARDVSKLWSAPEFQKLSYACCGKGQGSFRQEPTNRGSKGCAWDSACAR
jgi:hypothetical protein